MTRRYTEQEWVTLAREKHLGRYLYEDCGYAGMAAKVTIRCPDHGLFTQRAQDHIRGGGCPECSAQARRHSILRSRAKSRISTAEMIVRFESVHGRTYDYTKVEFAGTKKPVTIVCREHGAFQQLPSNHLKGSGCRNCGSNRAAAKHKLDQAEFERRVRQTHGKRYGLALAFYLTQYDNVTVHCAEHGEFSILPLNLWQGSGCPRCARLEGGKKHRITQEDYLRRAEEVHGTTYDHGLIQFTRMHDRIVVVCRNHGQFSPTAVNYLAGRGCKVCGTSRAAAARTPKLVFQVDEVLARFHETHGDQYDYTSVVYEHSNRHVTIVCRRHGAFLQTPSGHWAGKGCPECGRLTRAESLILTTEEAVARFRQLHGDRYDYADTVYDRFRRRVTIRCKRHGPFLQSPQAHLEGKGCPRCSQSSGETRAAAWLQKHGIEFLVESPVSIEGQTRCRFDFFLPDYSTFVEIDGPHHFAPVRYAGMSSEKALEVFHSTQRRDALKENWAAKNGLLVYRIRWDDQIEERLDQLIRRQQTDVS